MEETLATEPSRHATEDAERRGPSTGMGEGPRAPLRAPEEASRLGVLRHKHFRTIWLASFGSYVGTWFEFVAVRWIVSQETKSEDWMAYLAAAQLCPSLVLGMVGGLVADSVNRRSLLVVTQFAMMLIALAMAGAAYFDYANKWVFLGLAFLQGIAAAFNMPAWQVLTPRLVPKSELTQAITVNGISFNMARVIGPAVGGGIMRAFRGAAIPAATVTGAIMAADATAHTAASRGAAALLFFNGAMFIIVMLAVLTTPDAPAPDEMRGLWRRPGEAWHRTREAAHWVWNRKGPRLLLLATVMFAVLATPIMQLMPLMVSEVYGRQEDTYGVLLAIMGFGAVGGGLAMRFLPKWYPMHHFIPVCIVSSGIVIGGFSLASDVVWGMLFIFIVGVFWMWSWNSMATAMQHLVDDQMRGRVSAVMNTIAVGLMPLGTVLASQSGHAMEWGLKKFRPDWVHSGTSTQLGLAAVSAMIVVAGLVMLIWRTPEVDGLKPGDIGYSQVPGLWRGITGEAHRPRARGAGVRCPTCLSELGVTPGGDNAACPECGTAVTQDMSADRTG
jgi:MFS family permease